MKNLTLIRHAKASRDNPLIQDFERPLSGRGLHDAPLIGKHLKKVHAFAPDALITSPAKRAFTTASIIARKAGLQDVPLLEEPRIYEAPVDTLAEVLRGLSDQIKHAALFGHNPGFEALANWLCGPGTIASLPTGGVVMLELKVKSWSQVDAGCGTLLEYFCPSQIGGGKEAYDS